MKRRLLLWALPAAVLIGGVLGTGVLASASIAPQASGFDAVAADAFMTAYLHRTGLPGAAIAVVQGDRVVHVAGYGHDGAGRPVTAETPMPIASLSKSVTALAVMQRSAARTSTGTCFGTSSRRSA
jgi:CubicO group peptidase (beta-lactamase class C family)